jgi:trans-aconitate 2-methyltransferase
MANWDGKGYEQISELQRQLAARSLAGLAFAGDERVLDVGCGDGFVTRMIAARLSRGAVVGIDASPRMIEVATSRPDPEGADLRFQVADVLRLPFRHEFDVVVSFNVLHWLVNQRAALASIARAMRPTGRAVVQQVCAGPRPSLERLAMQVCARPRWQAAFGDFAAPFVHVDPEQYPELAAAAGLTVTSRSVEDVEWDFGSRAAFARWCTVGFADWTARLPPDEAPTWVDEVVDDYQARVGRPGLFRFLQLRAELSPTR